MSLPDNESYKIKAGNFQFTVKKSVALAYSSDKPVKHLLRVGGEDMCMEYVYNDINPYNVVLQWLHTAGQKCADGEVTIRGENTVLLIYASVKALRQYTPVKYIDFLDNSHFLCKLPNNSTVKIFLNRYYFVLHGKTWYHAKFGAYPIPENDALRYESYISNYDNPTKKPSEFDFMNADLNKLFLPIWNSTKTWREFMNEIKKFPNICQKMFPWYLSAASIIMGGSQMPDNLRIDVGKLNMKNIKVERVEKQAGGRIRMKNYIYDLFVAPDCPIPRECRKLKYI